MISLTIDGIPVEVPKGTMILEAAERAGIRIPTLCNNKRLQPFGACRICVVQQKGRRNLIPACFNPVRNGMEILTNTPEVIEARRTQLQLILLSHPLDCPVCDAGGRCALQDLVYEYGIVDNPFPTRRTEEPVDHATPFIERNVNRCILCGMCVRIDDEVVGANELSFLNRGDKIRIGTDFNRPMNCEFCGQCISVCPVGALNDRLFLHKARPWDLQETDTICGYCSVGCLIKIGTREGRIVRVRSDENVGANDGNLCVKGRFGWEYIQSPERLTSPLVRKDGELVPVSWEEALVYAAGRFREIRDGGGRMAGLGSARLTNEEAYLFQKLMRGVLHTNSIDHAGGESYAGLLALRESLGYAASTASFRDIRNADVVFMLGSDISDSHPVVKYEVVRAVKRRKAVLVTADSRTGRLGKFAALVLRSNPGSEVALLNALTYTVLEENLADRAFIETRTEGLNNLEASLAACSPEATAEITGVRAEEVRRAARLFAGAKRAVLLMGDGAADNFMTARAAANLALAAGQIGKPGTGIILLGEKNNSQGALDMGLVPSLLPGYGDAGSRADRNRLAEIWGMRLPDDPGMTAPEMTEAARGGKLRAMYIVGENPVLSFPDTESTRKALTALDFLVIQDCFPTETAALADVVFPAASFAEKEGTFTNSERRVQRIRPAVAPPGLALPDLKIFHALAEALGRPPGAFGGPTGVAAVFGESPRAVMEEIRAAVPLYAGIDYGRLDADKNLAGLQWPCVSTTDPGTPGLYEHEFPGGKAKFIATEAKPQSPSPDFHRLLVTGPVVFHSGSLSARSAGLKSLRGEDLVEIHPQDAEKIGCVNGGQVFLESALGKVLVKAVLSKQVLPGTVFLSRHFGTVNCLRRQGEKTVKVRIMKGEG